ncbi:hypothetical protein H0H10_21830 [Streptomyces sp. TRM S81-3]|uniref:Uncharacterized protein n=1 Tax=Streptomyces griseicoloratus TaxID=2752516 RepID=A0A926L7G7_9ACTN|nr:hypothetical protein [Streptomyces griseicoloratus]MBD0421761.1 hypothetical protein [Streptomyces griseicoloratus]
MKLSFLDPLFAEPGPWASVCVDTSQDVDDPGRAIDLRRRHLRDALFEQGADAGTVSALDAAVGTDHEVPGRHGQALFAAHGRLVLAAALPEPPARDTARFGALPDAMPPAVQRAPDIPYMAVLLFHDERAPRDDEPGEDRPPDHICAIAETGHWPLARVSPGPRLSHQVPVDEWPQTARRIAQELGDLAARHRTEVLVLGRHEDDGWAAGVLVNRMPIHLHNRVALVDSDSGAADGTAPGRALLEAEAGRVLERRLSDEDQRQVDTFQAQRARHPHRSEGITAAVTALQRAQARSLLLTRSPALPDELWTAEEPPWIALSYEELTAFGVTSAHPEPASAVLLYAAVRTGAELIVLPGDHVSPADGVAVLLRYRDAADMAPA